MNTLEWKNMVYNILQFFSAFKMRWEIFPNKREKQDRSHQWSTHPAHSSERQWFSIDLKVLGGRTNRQTVWKQRSLPPGTVVGLVDLKNRTKESFRDFIFEWQFILLTHKGCVVVVVSSHSPFLVHTHFSSSEVMTHKILKIAPKLF